MATLFLMMFLGCSTTKEIPIEVKPSYEMVAPLTLPTLDSPYYTGLVKAYLESLDEIKQGNNQLDAIIRLYSM